MPRTFTPAEYRAMTPSEHQINFPIALSEHETGIASLEAGLEIADGGDGQPIPVLFSGYVALESGAGAETRTIAVPTFGGQRITLGMSVDGGGDIAITAAAAIDAAGTTVMNFANVGEQITLVAIDVAGAFLWRVLGVDGVPVPESIFAIDDPLTGNAIPVISSGYCALTSLGAAETRTLAIPSFADQRITLAHDTDGGDITVTVASAFNEAGETDIVFVNAGEYIDLIAVTIGAVLTWRVLGFDGVALKDPSVLIVDPATGNAIPVVYSGHCALTSLGAAETRTLAIPTFVGQRLVMTHTVDGGDITVTVASAFNEAGETDIVFVNAGEYAELVCVNIGGVLFWRLTSSDGIPVQDPAVLIVDPATGNAISVTHGGYCALTSVGGGETRTMAAPSFAGQRIVLCHDTDGGDIAITVASAINQAANTIMTFADVNDSVELYAITIGGVLFWRIFANDGVALS